MVFGSSPMRPAADAAVEELQGLGRVLRHQAQRDRRARRRTRPARSRRACSGPPHDPQGHRVAAAFAILIVLNVPLWRARHRAQRPGRRSRDPNGPGPVQLPHRAPSPKSGPAKSPRGGHGWQGGSASTGSTLIDIWVPASWGQKAGMTSRSSRCRTSATTREYEYSRKGLPYRLLDPHARSPGPDAPSGSPGFLPMLRAAPVLPLLDSCPAKPKRCCRLRSPRTKPVQGPQPLLCLRFGPGAITTPQR